jgi:hypothetical protein
MLRRQAQHYELQEREERLQQEKEAAAAARRRQEHEQQLQQRRRQASVHPYDALFHPNATQRMVEGQAQHLGSRHRQVLPPTAAAAVEAVRQPLQTHRQYATIGGTMDRTFGGGTQCGQYDCHSDRRTAQPQQTPIQRAAVVMDARLFSPLGAGAALLTREQQQEQRRAALVASQAAERPYYRTIG